MMFFYFKTHIFVLKYIMKEEDLFDLALFGITNKDWKEQNPDKKGNIMDHASLAEQITRIGMKALNKVMINKGADETTRLV